MKVVTDGAKMQERAQSFGHRLMASRPKRQVRNLTLALPITKLCSNPQRCLWSLKYLQGLLLSTELRIAAKYHQVRPTNPPKISHLAASKKALLPQDHDHDKSHTLR